MDQTAPADQGFLRHQRECGEDPNLDCGIGVRAGGDRAQTVGTGGQSVSNPTDSQRIAFRENAHFMRPSGHRRECQFHRKRQPTDSVRLLTGQQWGTEHPTHRTRTLVRTEDATAIMARLRKAKLGQPMAAGTVMPKPQSLTGRRRLAPATIWMRAFWDWRRPSVRRYSEAFCESTGAPTSLS